MQGQNCEFELFIFPQGVLSECISPDAGLYQLDGGILLYMTDKHCIDGGRGLRPGASLQLHEVHAMKLPPPLQVSLLHSLSCRVE